MRSPDRPPHRQGGSLRPLAIAHRGDPLAHRENTLVAYAAAVRAGADMIEIDVRRTADGAAVCLHDPTLERLWGDERHVAELTLREVRVVGDGASRIPELGEVLAAVDAPLMVDYVDEDVVEPALAAIRSAGALARSLFSGANVDGHRLLRSLAPDARIALTWAHHELPPGSLLEELAVEYVNPDRVVLGAELVEAAHARGALVSTWTVDEPAEMREALDLGVDAVVTNRIAELVALIGERVLVGEPSC